MRRVLLLGLVSTACSNSPVATPTSAVAAFRAVGPEIATLVDHTVNPARATTHEVLVATRGLSARLHDDGTVHLSGATPLVFTMRGAGGPARVEGAHAVVDAGAVRTLVFDRGAAIEVLHHVPSPTALTYEIQLPPAHTLSRVEDGAGGTIEVRDASAVPRVRLTADAAWDRFGRKVPVRLEASGARIDVRVPADVAYPIVIDPAWSPTTSPARLRQDHGATLLGNGQVLLTGGGTSTAEVYDLVHGRFSAVASMTSARRGHSATLLLDGRVLVAGGGSAFTELYDPEKRTFSSGPTLTKISGRTGAVRLDSGKVLLTDASSAELWDPATVTLTTVPRAAAGGVIPAPLRDGTVLYVGAGVAELYRPATNDFVALAAPSDVTATCLVTPTASGALVYGAAQAFLVGGTPTSFRLVNYAYSAASKTFTPPAPPTLPLAPPKVVGAPSVGQLGLTLPSGRVLYVGAKAQTYDPTTTDWSTAEALPQDHEGGALTMLPSGAVLVTGGASGGATVYVAGDGVPGAFASAGSLSVGRVNGAATRLLDGRVLLSGGSAPPGASGVDGRSSADVYDPAANSWSAGGTLRAPRALHAQALLPSGRVLIAGGTGASTAELWDPSTKTTTATGSLSLVREGAAATTLPNGKVLIAGGTGLSTAELFDETKGAFTPITSRMALPHAQFGAVVLPTGRVLLVDGTTSELFDPATETFSAGPTLSSARDGRTATVLPSGDVVVGGLGPSLPLERYDAETGTFQLTGPLSRDVRGQSAAPLPFGRVLFGFGTDPAAFVTVGSTFLFDALAEAARGGSSPGPTGEARQTTTLVPLARGGVLMAGGDGCAGGCFGAPSVTTARFELPGPPSADRATITKTPALLIPGATFDVEGLGLVGKRETTGASSGRVPSFLFVPASGQGSVIATTLSFSDTSAKVRLPATSYRGKGFLHASVAGVTGPGALVELGPAAQGSACVVDGDCASGFCTDGVCCDKRCDGTCDACTKERRGYGADGTCAAIPPDKSGKDACALYQGAPCTKDAECGTGICADGVCCDARCEGQCEACNVASSLGKCVPVLGAPIGVRPACEAGSDTCSARRCDGVERAKCAGFAPTTTACGKAACKAGTATSATFCDGKGACQPAALKACGGFACDEAGVACVARCTTSKECAPRFRCVEGQCVTGSYCVNERTLREVTSDAERDSDCSPYACAGNDCRRTCGTSLDCLGGFVCSNGACVAPTQGTTQDGGCTSAGGGHRGSATFLVVLAALGGLSRLRRRR